MPKIPFAKIKEKIPGSRHAELEQLGQFWDGYTGMRNGIIYNINGLAPNQKIGETIFSAFPFQKTKEELQDPKETSVAYINKLTSKASDFKKKLSMEELAALKCYEFHSKLAAIQLQIYAIEQDYEHNNGAKAEYLLPALSQMIHDYNAVCLKYKTPQLSPTDISKDFTAASAVVMEQRQKFQDKGLNTKKYNYVIKQLNEIDHKVELEVDKLVQMHDKLVEQGPRSFGFFKGDPKQHQEKLQKIEMTIESLKDLRDNINTTMTLPTEINCKNQADLDKWTDTMKDRMNNMDPNQKIFSKDNKFISSAKYIGKIIEKAVNKIEKFFENYSNSSKPKL